MKWLTHPSAEDSSVCRTENIERRPARRLNHYNLKAQLPTQTSLSCFLSGGTENTSMSILVTTGLPKARYLKDNIPVSIQVCKVVWNFRSNIQLFLDCRRHLAIVMSSQQGFPNTVYLKQTTAKVKQEVRTYFCLSSLPASFVNFLTQLHALPPSPGWVQQLSPIKRKDLTIF